MMLTKYQNEALIKTHVSDALSLRELATINCELEVVPRATRLDCNSRCRHSRLRRRSRDFLEGLVRHATAALAAGLQSSNASLPCATGISVGAGPTGRSGADREFRKSSA